MCDLFEMVGYIWKDDVLIDFDGVFVFFMLFVFFGWSDWNMV